MSCSNVAKKEVEVTEGLSSSELNHLHLSPLRLALPAVLANFRQGSAISP